MRFSGGGELGLGGGEFRKFWLVGGDFPPIPFPLGRTLVIIDIATKACFRKKVIHMKTFLIGHRTNKGLHFRYLRRKGGPGLEKHVKLIF